MTLRRTEIIFAAKTMLKKGMRLLEHKHAYYQFAYLVSGSMTITVDRKEYSLTPGDCVLYPSNALHAILPVEENVVQFELKFTVEDKDLHKNLPLLPAVFPSGAQTEAILACIVDYAHTRTEEDADNADNFLYALLSGFIQDKFRSRERDSIYILTEGYNTVTKKILVEIEKNFDKPFSLSELGKTLNYNENYLSSTFKRNTGVSVIDYLNLTRIRHAIIWFSYNALDVTTVYETAGFASINHFSRTFRKYTGVSPREYRKAFPHLFSREFEDSTFSSEPFFMNSRMTMTEAFATVRRLGDLTRERLSDAGNEDIPDVISKMHL